MTRKKERVICSDAILNIVDQRIAHYKNHYIPRELMMRAEFCFSDALHQVRGSFWHDWSRAEAARIPFAARVEEVLKGICRLKRGENIKKSAWPEMLARARVQLAITLRATNDSNILGQKLDKGDIDLVEAARYLPSVILVGNEKNMILNPGSTIIDEWIAASARAVVRQILRDMENIMPLAPCSWRYIQTQARDLANYYRENSGDSYFDQCDPNGLMNVSHVENEFTVATVMDDIIEQVIRMKMAHDAGFIHHYSADTKPSELEQVWSRSEIYADRGRLVKVLLDKHRHTLNKRGRAPNIRKIVSCVYQAIQ